MDTDSQIFKSLFVRGCNEVNPVDEVSEDSIRSILVLILKTCKKLYQKDTISIQHTHDQLLVKDLLSLIEKTTPIIIR